MWWSCWCRWGSVPLGVAAVPMEGSCSLGKGAAPREGRSVLIGDGVVPVREGGVFP
jgi:hypothetical protein